jgi:hypothetical protein
MIRSLSGNGSAGSQQADARTTLLPVPMVTPAHGWFRQMKMNKSILSRFAVSMLLAGSARLSSPEVITQAPTTAPATHPPPLRAALRHAAPVEVHGVLIKPVSDETHNLVSVKDPTVVRFQWHICNHRANWAWFT